MMKASLLILLKGYKKQGGEQCKDAIETTTLNGQKGDRKGDNVHIRLRTRLQVKLLIVLRLQQTSSVQVCASAQPARLPRRT